jgi:coproporphyrinogen III oxidase-like Fe-S oxidoreductase
MLGLRRVQGIDNKQFLTLTGISLKQFLDGARIDDLSEGGFIIVDRNGIRTTPAGRQRLNAILKHLLT